MKKTAVAPALGTALAVALGSFLAAASLPAAETLHERAMRLQKSAIIVDTHEDVPEELAKVGHGI